MRNVASWASRNPWTARFLIIFLYLPLNIAGLMLGDLLFDRGYEFPSFVLYGACLVALAVILYYPSRRHAIFLKNFYVKRKSADFLLLFSTVCMIAFIGNHLNTGKTFSLITKAGGLSATGNYEASSFTASVHPKKPIKKIVQKKQLRKKVVSLIKTLRKKYRDTSDGTKILLIFLAVVVIAATVVLLLGLVCAIGCGGAEAISYILLTLGVGLGIFLTFLIFKRLSRNHPKNQEIKPPPSQGT